jgi:hypothetical protein
MVRRQKVSMQSCGYGYAMPASAVPCGVPLIQSSDSARSISSFQISIYCGKSGAMPTLAVGMIDFSEKTRHGHTSVAMAPSFFSFPQQKQITPIREVVPSIYLLLIIYS